MDLMTMDRLIENLAVASARFYDEDGRKIGAVRLNRLTPGNEEGQIRVEPVVLVSGVGRIAYAVLVLPVENRTTRVAVAEIEGGQADVFFYVQSLDVTQEQPLHVLPMLISTTVQDAVRDVIEKAMEKLKPAPLGVAVVLRKRLPGQCEDCGQGAGWTEAPELVTRYHVPSTTRAYRCMTVGCDHVEFLKPE